MCPAAVAPKAEGDPFCAVTLTRHGPAVLRSWLLPDPASPYVRSSAAGLRSIPGPAAGAPPAPRRRAASPGADLPYKLQPRRRIPARNRRTSPTACAFMLRGYPSGKVRPASPSRPAVATRPRCRPQQATCEMEHPRAIAQPCTVLLHPVPPCASPIQPLSRLCCPAAPSVRHGSRTRGAVPVPSAWQDAPATAPPAPSPSSSKGPHPASLRPPGPPSACSTACC